MPEQPEWRPVMDTRIDRLRIPVHVHVMAYNLIRPVISINFHTICQPPAAQNAPIKFQPHVYTDRLQQQPAGAADVASFATTEASERTAAR